MNALIDYPEGEAVINPSTISLPVGMLRNAVTKAALVVERRNCIPIIGAALVRWVGSAEQMRGKDKSGWA